MKQFNLMLNANSGNYAINRAANCFTVFSNIAIN